GAILYEALTGRPPLQGASVLDTLEQVRTQEPVPPRQLQPRVPRDLETVCLKCLEKDPRRRYGSAAALADDMQRLLGGRPVLARPVAAGERLVKWPRRHPTVAGLTALLVLVTVVGFALVAWQWLRAEGARQEAVVRATAEAALRTEARQAQQKAEAEQRQTARQLDRAEMGLYVNLLSWAEHAWLLDD